jgi:hypothetical protein
VAFSFAQSNVDGASCHAGAKEGNQSFLLAIDSVLADLWREGDLRIAGTIGAFTL